MNQKKLYTKNLHIGKFIKQYIDAHNINITELSEKIHYSRRNLYQIFEKESVDTSLLDKLHKTLGDEFIKQYLKEKYLSQIQSIFSEQSPHREKLLHNLLANPKFINELLTIDKQIEKEKYTDLNQSLSSIDAKLELLLTQQKTTMHLLNLFVEKLS